MKKLYFLKKTYLFVLLLYFILIVPFHQNIEASWNKVIIPGAFCGYGQPYSVFIREGINESYSIDFAMGGACWNFSTCIGPTPLTLLFTLPKDPLSTGIMSDDLNVSALAEHTHLFFPYCTGDIFAGDSISFYWGIPIFHSGYKNIELALSYLHEKNYIQLSKAKQVVLFGASAGALGAMAHVKNIEPYLNEKTDRVVISDSPGLHFGDDFFKKFSSESFQSYKEKFQKVGMNIERDNGLVAPEVISLCQQYPMWRFGFLQSTRDLIMSQLFGNISPSEHHNNVMGNRGLFQLVKNPRSNCFAWVTDSYWHVFLLTRQTGFVESFSGESAVNFTNSLIWGLKGHVTDDFLSSTSL